MGKPEYSEHHMHKEIAHPAPQHKIKHVKKPRGMGLMDKLLLFILVVSAVYVGYLYFQQDIIRILKMNPYVWAVFSHIAGEISRRTLMGLFYASFFGSLFFIFLPLEVLFLYYLSLGYSVPVMIALALIGNAIGLCLDYLFGFTVGASIVKFFFRKNFEKFHSMITKWGAFIVLIGNIIPFPIQVVSVIVGSARYSFKKFFFFTVIGIFAKLFALVVLSMYLAEYIPAFA